MRELIEQHGDVAVAVCGVLGLVAVLGACFVEFQDSVIQFFSSIFFR